MFTTLYMNSPIGTLKITGSENGISSIKLVNESPPDQQEVPDLLLECQTQLSEYFAGVRKKFDLKLDFSDASEFYQDVWKLVQIIPYGRTRSYFDIAKALGNPQAVRAVGTANGKNPFPIVIPCHRVIGKNGSLTGYAYGIKAKQLLLHLENPSVFVTQTSLFQV